MELIAYYSGVGSLNHDLVHIPLAVLIRIARLPYRAVNQGLI